MLEHISGYMNEKKVTENDQHGFTVNSFGLTNLIVLCDKMAESVDEGKAMDIIYLDISKAFSIVSKSMPTTRLGCYRQDGQTARV